MTIRDIPPVDETAQNDETEPEGGETGSPDEPAGLPIGEIDPEKKHGWDVEDFKNGAALRIVVACLAVMTVSAFVEHFCPMLRGNDPLADLFDAFKLIATTALGFLFGRNSK